MSIRDRFPIFQKKVYLNSCSQGALSIDVKQAYETYLKDWDEKGSPWELWVERSEAARHGALITLRSHKVDMLVKRLEEDHIITSSRDDNLRISPHIYNNLADVDRLMDCLAKHREPLV